jgi:hypothetical protein
MIALIQAFWRNERRLKSLGENPWRVRKRRAK